MDIPRTFFIYQNYYVRILSWPNLMFGLRKEEAVLHSDFIGSSGSKWS